MAKRVLVSDPVVLVDLISVTGMRTYGFAELRNYVRDSI